VRSVGDAILTEFKERNGMAQAIVLRQPGGPLALRLEEVTVAPPAAGELRLRHTAIGMNFHDIYVRTGLYRTLELPGVPGIEAAGVVEAVGAGITNFREGDRVAYVTPRYGAYATHRVLPADLAIKLPPWLDDRIAASVLVRGLTVEVLTGPVHHVKPGERVLVHAAAGGVGRLLCQRLKDLGAVVFGTAGSPEKAAVARAAGCQVVIQYRNEDFVACVRDLTSGGGVSVVYDSVGKDTFLGSLDCLALRGHLVNFGQASGAVPPFEISRLAAGSYTVSRPILFHYLIEQSERDSLVAALFGALQRKALTADDVRNFPLAQVGAAQAELESRRSTGSIILLP
jgi:NADPH2:quinone reductase